LCDEKHSQVPEPPMEEYEEESVDDDELEPDPEFDHGGTK
jgi:hypothetical protein